MVVVNIKMTMELQCVKLVQLAMNAQTLQYQDVNPKKIQLYLIIAQEQLEQDNTALQEPSIMLIDLQL